MKYHKTAMASLLILIFMVSMFSVNAEGIQPYASELITSRSIVAADEGGTSFSFTARIVGKGTLDQIGFNSIRIQKYDDETNTWDTVKAVYSKFGYETSIYAYTVSHTGSAGEQYRCKVTFYAKDGNTSDTKYQTSASITI